MFYNSVDGNGNFINVHELASFSLSDDATTAVVRLHSSPETGYVALMYNGGAFGDWDCPSSYNCQCLTWFGPGEKYPDARTAIMAMK